MVFSKHLQHALLSTAGAITCLVPRGTHGEDVTDSVANFNALMALVVACGNEDTLEATITADFTEASGGIWSSELTIADGCEVTLIGRPSGPYFVMDAAASSRHLVVNDGASLIITGLEFTNGYANYSGGGAIIAYGTLTISDSTFSNNSAYSGGAIFTYGTLTISDSTFSNNSATTYEGGAIFAYGTLTISDSTFSNNSAYTGGGAIFAYGTLTISDSTFSNNSATTDGADILMVPSAKMIVNCATQPTIGQVYLYTTTGLYFSTCSNGLPAESSAFSIGGAGNYVVNGFDEPKCPSGLSETCASCDTGYAQSAVDGACDECATGYTGETCNTCATGYAGVSCNTCAPDYVDDGKGGCTVPDVGTASIVHSTSIGFVSLVIVMTAMGVLP